MSPRRRFELIYAPEVKKHLERIERKYYGLIRREIEAQLQSEPDVETRNRKPLRGSLALEADWEMRVGPGNRFRVFYQMEPSERTVYILAIGVKEQNRLVIGGEEIEL